MKTVAYDPQKAGVSLGQIIPPKPEEFSFGETLAASFLQENDVVNAMEYMLRPSFPREEGFDILAAIDADELGERYADQFSRAQSAAEFASIKAKILQEERNKQILSASPITGFITSAVAGMLSPTSLVPLMGPSKGLKGAAEAFALAGASVGAQEAVLYGLQETRTKEEVSMGVAVGTVLGGLLGTAVRYATPNELELLEARMVQSQSDMTISAPREDGGMDHFELSPDDGFVQQAGQPAAVGAAAAPRTLPEPTISRTITRKKSSDEEALSYGGSYLRTELPNGYEVRFTKATPGSGGAYFTGGEYAMTILRKDGTEVSGVQPDARSPNARLAGNTFTERVKDLREAFEAGKLDKQIDEILESAGEPRIMEAGAQSAEPSPSLSAARVREETGGIKRANTYVGRQVDRGADWLAAKGVPVAPKVIKTLNDPIGMLAKLSPLTRQLENKVFPSMRGWAAQLQVPGIKLEGGMARQGDTYSRAGVHAAAQADFIRAWDSAWMQYITEGKGKPQVQAAVAARYKITGESANGKLSYREFGDEVFRLAQTQGRSDDPAIDAGIGALREYFDYVDGIADKYHKFRLEQDGTLDEEGVLTGVRPLYKRMEFSDESEIQFYVHHIFDDVAVEKNTTEFLRDFSAHGERLMNDSFTRDYERFAKRRDGMVALQKILQMDEGAITKLATDLSAMRTAIDDQYGAMLKQVKNLRKSMKAAGAEKAEIDDSARQMEEVFGPEYSAAMKQRREIDKELSVLRKVGAGLTEKQIDLLDQIDALEEMQLNELERVANAGARLAAKLASLDQKQARTDAAIKRDYETLRKAGQAYLREQKKAAKLEASDTLTQAAADTRIDKSVDRMNNALARLDKNESLDFDALRELQESAMQGVLVRTRELNAKRVLREERIKERAAKADPDERAKYREEEGVRLRQVLDDFEDAFEIKWREKGATGQPARGAVDFAEQARQDAEELYKKILGNPLRVIGIEVLTGKRGPELQRMLNVPLETKMKYLVRQPETVVRAHGHSMFPDLEMYRMTGSVNGAPVFEELEMDYSRALAKLEAVEDGPKREAASQKLRRDYENTMKDWQVLIDRFRHQRAVPSNANALGYRMGRFAMNLNVTRFMGMVAVSSLPDLARVTFRYGMRGAFNDAWKPLLTDIPRVRAVRAEANRAGIALDPLLHSRAAMINDTFDNQATRQNMLERGMEFLANKTGFVALFDRWTAEMKYLATNAVFGEFSHALRVVNNPAEFSAKEIKKAQAMLRDVSLDSDMATRIWKQYTKEGGSSEFKDGFRLPNTEVWDDFEAMMALRAGVNRVVNDLIITPGLDRPSWMDENLPFKMIAQFRSFTYTSTTRVLMSGLQEPDMVFLQGAIFSIALGALSYYTWAATAGGRAWEEAMQMDEEKWLYEAVNRSGILAVLSEGQRIGEQIPGLNDWAIFGANESQTRRAGSLLGAVLGPSYDLAERLATVAQNIHDPTASTVHTARTAMVPYQNVVYLRKLLDSMEESLTNTLGIPDRR